MAPAQIRLALEACDRRDAAMALRSLDVTHSAVAPIMGGAKGLSAYEKCARFLKGIITPAAKVSPFQALFARAKAEQAARGGQ